MDFALDFYGLLTMGSRKPSSSFAAASKPAISSAALSPAKDSAARRSCSKCSRRMSSYVNDKHSLCLHCRDVLCSVDVRCQECQDRYVRIYQVSQIISFEGEEAFVGGHPKTPVTDSARPSQVASPVSAIPSPASEEGLKSLMHSILASFLSQPSSLGSNPFVAAPSAEVPNVSHSGSAGGSQDDNLMRGCPVAPSGMVPPPHQEDNPPPPTPPMCMCL